MKEFDIVSEFEKYRSDYLSFLESSNHKQFTADIRDFDDYISFMHFAPLSENSHKTFLIIPSIFNSPDILNIGRPDDIITNLRSLGNVFLIDWKEIKNPNSTLTNYIDSSCNLLSELSSDRKIDLLGHCLGGNIALAINILKPELIRSLILLSTPWDFSFLSEFRELHKKLLLDSAVKDLDYIPAIYFQILFFLMNQYSFREKINYYINNKNKFNIDDFFTIEKWQFSGQDLPRSLYIELMDDIIGGNIMFNNMWKIDGNIIDPSIIANEVLIITGKKDRLVPSCSSTPLANIIQQSRKFEYNTGHIGYLIGSQKEHFMLDLINSLKIG